MISSPPFLQPAPYLHIASTLAACVATKSRLRIAAALINCFRSLLALAPADLLPAVYLITGKARVCSPSDDPQYDLIQYYIT